MIVLRALGALLSYPQEEIRQALPEITEAIRASQLIPPRQREDLLTLIDELRADDLLKVEERYVELFDRGLLADRVRPCRNGRHLATGLWCRAR